MRRLRRYLLAVMIALNQTVNALTGGNPQESVSSRLGEARDHGSRVARVLCAALETVDFHPPERADHCTMAVIEHLKRLADNLEAAKGQE